MNNLFKFEDSIVLVPLYDVHIGSPTFDEEAFKNTLRLISKNSNYYYFIDGDICENICPTDKINPYDQTSQPHEQLDLVFKYLSPIKHKCLFAIDGNHLGRTRKRAYLNIMHTIAKVLDTRYLGIGGYVKFNVGKNRYTLATQHGYSASSNSETELSRLKTVYSEADIYLLGHDHQLFARPKAFISVDDAGKESIELKWFCRGGSYINYAAYARERLYSIVPTGSLQIKLSAHGRGIRIDPIMYVNSQILK